MMTSQIIPEQFYTSEEVSEFLRLSLRTVQRLLANHSLSAYKVHGQYRIKGLDLLTYLDSTRQGELTALPKIPASYTEYLNVQVVFHSESVVLTDPQAALDTVMAHLTQVVCRHAHEMLSRDEVAVMVEKIRESRPVVVEEVMRTEINPQGLTLGQLTQVLRYLLKENVSIQHMGLILEGLADSLTGGNETPTIEALGENLRQYLCRQINAPLANTEGVIAVLTLEPELEQYLEHMMPSTQQDAAYYATLNAVRSQLKTAPVSTIICSLALRRHLFRLLYRHSPHIQVLSYQEIHEDYRVKSVLRLRGCAES